MGRARNDLVLPMGLCFIGVLLAAISLLIPWVALDVPKLEQWLLTSPEMRSLNPNGQATVLSPQDASLLHEGMRAAGERARSEFVGIKWLSLPALALMVLPGMGATALCFQTPEHEVVRRALGQRIAVAGALMLATPLWTLTHLDGTGELRALFHGQDVVLAANGVYLAALGGFLVLLSGAWAMFTPDSEPALSSVDSTVLPAHVAPGPSYSYGAGPATASACDASAPPTTSAPTYVPQPPAYIAPPPAAGPAPAPGSVPPPGYPFSS